jgi:hypothetical protein
MEPLLRRPRRWLALAALAVAALYVPTASAGSAAAIKGVGAGETSLGFIKFELSAHAEADPTTPENGFGQVKFELQTGPQAGSVTVDVRCVTAQVGSTGRPHATISGVVTRSTIPTALFAPGTTAEVVVSDGGEPAADLPVDTFRPAHLSNAVPETSCLVPSFDFPPNVTQGNIVVKL